MFNYHKKETFQSQTTEFSDDVRDINEPLRFVSLSPALYDCKSDPRNHVDWSTDYMLYKSCCLIILRT